VSFIFDALRKSENERQRGSVPDIARIPLATPQQHMPRWALACIALLGVCVAVLAGAWWQAERSSDAARGNSLRVALPLPVPATAPSVERSRAPDAPRATPTQPSPEEIAPAQRGSALAEAVAVGETGPTSAPTIVAAASSAAGSAAPSRAPPERILLPSLAQLRASGIEVPSLQLQLHSYSDTAANRFVFINGARYEEGERLQDGPQLLRITAEGVVLSQSSREFLLRVE
jgi:hypothetical protein